MLRLVYPLPKKIYVAVSGGVDSMAALDFLARSHEVIIAHFDHQNGFSETEKAFVIDQASRLGLPIATSQSRLIPTKKDNLEDFWRKERYEFFQWLMQDSKAPALGAPVVTAHHLDDAVETWVWSSMHGTPRLPRINYNGVLRPFLTTPKSALVDWADRHNVPSIFDTTNSDPTRMRGYMRSVAMPVIEQINPGIRKTIAKKINNLVKNDPTALDSNTEDVIIPV